MLPHAHVCGGCLNTGLCYSCLFVYINFIFELILGGAQEGRTMWRFKGGLLSLAGIAIPVQQSAHFHGAGGHNRQEGEKPDVNIRCDPCDGFVEGHQQEKRSHLLLPIQIIARPPTFRFCFSKHRRCPQLISSPLFHLPGRERRRHKEK